ncbi:hypothetical protein [Corynebacterium epidermidicanis]|nr:hypothetical protein [Corynebacterium epidermidicanis]
MNDNVIDLKARRAAAGGVFAGTPLAQLGRTTSTHLAKLTASARGMRRPVQLTALVDATWPASEVIEQLQVLLLREPRNSATITRHDGHIIGDSRYLFHCSPFLESHATTIEEACQGGALFEFDPITNWHFDLTLSPAPHSTDINAAQLLELQEQTGAVPLNFSPAMQTPCSGFSTTTPPPSRPGCWQKFCTATASCTSRRREQSTPEDSSWCTGCCANWN